MLTLDLEGDLGILLIPTFLISGTFPTRIAPMTTMVALCIMQLMSGGRCLTPGIFSALRFLGLRSFALLRWV